MLMVEVNITMEVDKILIKKVMKIKKVNNLIPHIMKKIVLNHYQIKI